MGLAGFDWLVSTSSTAPATSRPARRSCRRSRTPARRRSCGSRASTSAGAARARCGGGRRARAALALGRGRAARPSSAAATAAGARRATTARGNGVCAADARRGGRADRLRRPDRDRGGARRGREIAAVDGVDVVFVGPADLAHSLGLECPPDDPELLGRAAAVADAARDHGKAAGVLVGTVAQAAAYRDAGFTFPRLRLGQRPARRHRAETSKRASWRARGRRHRRPRGTEGWTRR